MHANVTVECRTGWLHFLIALAGRVMRVFSPRVAVPILRVLLWPAFFRIRVGGRRWEWHRLPIVVTLRIAAPTEPTR